MKKLPVPGICAQYRQFCSVLIRGRSDLQAADGLGQEALGIIAREPALGIRRAVGIGKDAEHGRARAAHDRAERAAVEQAALDGRDLALAVGEHVLKDVVHPAGEPGHIPVGERALWSVICNYAYRKDTDIFIKGDSPDKEEYSIFDNLESLSVISDILLDFESDPDNEIRVVGIAGDYCVHETICDLIAMGYKDNIVVDTKYIASIDGGDKLANLIKNCGLKWD